MRAFCGVLFWIFGACSDAAPELIANAATQDDADVAYPAPDLAGIDISDIDNARSRCVIKTVDTIFGITCIPVELRFDYTYRLPGPCNNPDAVGCTYIDDGTAYVYISIDGQRRPWTIYAFDPILDVYVHEMTHVESFCINGDSDTGHTRPVWGDELKLRFAYAKQRATEAGCYNL